MKETGTAECSDLVCHGQWTVQENTKVVHNSRQKGLAVASIVQDVV